MQPPSINVDKVLWTARLAMAIFAVMLAVTVFFFTRRLFDDASALVALAHLQLASALKGMGRRAEAHDEYLRAEKIASAQPEWYFLQKPEIQDGVRDQP